MGKLGKETKTLLIAVTAICLVSFLLAGGIATLLAKNFQQELLLHDYGVAGHLLNNESELSISAFTSQSNENDIELWLLLDMMKRLPCVFCLLSRYTEIRQCFLYFCC